ncbi:Hypothetical protein PBC10988_14210 [Planctomycetales bacterium 10988]|nr:Hypothetical protein PBC10988_14210 [Planctomycetales bacterium 10988]
MSPISRTFLRLLAPLLLVVIIGFSIDNRVRELLANTLFFSAGTLAISLPLGLILASLLFRTDCPGRKLGLVFLIAILGLPPFFIAGAWQSVFDWPWLSGLFPEDLRHSAWIHALWIQGMIGVPWVCFICGIGLLFVPREMEELRLLERSAMVAFCEISLRYSLGAILAASLWAVVRGVTDMTVTDLYQVRTYAEELYTQIAVTGDVEEAALAILPGTLLQLTIFSIVLFGIFRLVPQYWPTAESWPLQYELGWKRWPVAAGAWLLLFFIVGVPLLGLIGQSGLDVEPTEKGLLRTWSGEKTLAMMGQSFVRIEEDGTWKAGRFNEELGWSLLIGTLAASAAVVSSVLFVWWIRERKGERYFLLFPIALMLSLPSPLVGFGITYLLNQPQVPLLVYLYDYSIAGPLLAQWLAAMPWTLLIVMHAFRSIPEPIMEQAACDGFRPWEQLLWIVLPLSRYTLLCAWLVALMISLGELGASILTVPPRVTLLSVRLWTLLHYGMTDWVAGVYLMLFLIFCGLGAILLRLAQQSWQMTQRTRF